MKVISCPEQVYELVLSEKLKNKTVGLVPTMGALHDGHLSLIKESLKQNDFTVVSVFVNPLQFNNPEDLEKYPRPFDEDKAFLEQHGVDLMFAPSEKEMYPEYPEALMNFGKMAKVMEGEFRPGHFDGVGLVVSKLFNIVAPHRAYFGLKDLQQYLLIRRMVKDFSIQVNLVGMPIVREGSGLAMSSRNTRLSDDGKSIAANIYKGLRLAQQQLANKKSIEETKSGIFDFYSGISGIEVEYLEFVNPDNLTPYSGGASPKDVAVCIAAYVEGVRLIDNLYLRQD